MKRSCPEELPTKGDGYSSTAGRATEGPQDSAHPIRLCNVGSAHRCPGSPSSGETAKQAPQKRHEGDGERCAGAGGLQKAAESRPQGGAERQTAQALRPRPTLGGFRDPGHYTV